MLSDRWALAPRRLSLLLLAAMLIPALALGWLTRLLLERNDLLEATRVHERAEHAADRIEAASHQRLSELEDRARAIVAGAETTPPAGAVLVNVEAGRITVAPNGALLYYPVLPSASPLPGNAFAEGERYENQLRDLLKAIAWFQTATQADDPSLRAGALLRLGRNQKKAGQTGAALATYAELETLGAIPVEGYPAAVLALDAQCDLLSVAGRTQELAAVAARFRTGLAHGAWPLVHDAYDFYAKEARRWSGEPDETDADAEGRALAATFQTTYESWANAGDVPQRQWLIANDRPILIATAATPDRLVALIAGSAFLQDAWRDVPGVEVLLTDPVGGRPIAGETSGASELEAVRRTDVSKLPWTLRVVATPLEADRFETAQQRRLLFAGLVIALVLFAGSVYLTLRGISRELAVARLQSDFVAAVSHEFRTPLASVRHLSDMLSRGRVSDEGQRQECYDFLSRESERLDRLVEDVLDFGRIEGGSYQYRLQPVEVAGLVRQLVDEFQDKLGADGHRVSLSSDVESTIVLADREALSRAVRNLLDNAVKYSPGADTIWVQVAVEHASMFIRVRDRGLGIAAGEQAAIFRKFVRGSNTRERQIKGTGIGLAMVRHIMAAHHGDVRVDSQEGQGSTFALRLPLQTQS